MLVTYSLYMIYKNIYINNGRCSEPKNEPYSLKIVWRRQGLKVTLLHCSKSRYNFKLESLGSVYMRHKDAILYSIELCIWNR